MDPDMVRQQEEAEREAIKLAPPKPPVPAPPPAGVADIMAGILASTALFFEEALPLDRTAAPAETAGGDAAGAPPAPSEVAAPSRPQAAPAKKKRNVLVLGFLKLGGFISYGLAGGILGGSLGILASNYLQLPPNGAQLVIFYSSGGLAALCGFTSLFRRD